MAAIRKPSGVPVSKRSTALTTPWNGDRAACARRASVSWISPSAPTRPVAISSNTSGVSTYRPMITSSLGASSTGGFSTRSRTATTPSASTGPAGSITP